MDLDLLNAVLDSVGEPQYRRQQAYHAATRSPATGWQEVTTLPAALRDRLEADVPWSTVSVDYEERSEDGSVKLRLRTAEGFPIEAVLMRFDTPHARSTGRYTACLSSQSGCALSCTFCATGRMKLGKSLSRYEILDQFLILSRVRRAAGGRIDNVVMMGMGEPFHNYDEVLAACRLMNDPDGAGLAARRIAISTVGWVPGIERLATEGLQVKLALSLHAPNDQLRARLMPVNRKFPIERLMKACRTYRAATRRRIFVEYLMLDGVNDRPEHARELAALLAGEGFHVNLIAYNPTDTEYVGSSDATVRAFAEILQREGVTASYRVSRGRDISAACGQLAAPLEEIKRRERARRAARSNADV